MPLNWLKHNKNVIFLGRSSSKMFLKMLELSPPHHFVSLAFVLPFLTLSSSMGGVELASSCITLSDRRFVEAAVNRASFVSFAVDRDSILIIDLSLIFTIVRFGGEFLLF